MERGAHGEGVGLPFRQQVGRGRRRGGAGLRAPTARRLRRRVRAPDRAVSAAGAGGSGRWGQGYGGSPGGPGVTETVGCQARGRSPRRRRAIAGTREVSAPGLRLGRARTPSPSPGAAAARKMSPGALRNGDPCWLPERLSPLPILAMRPWLQYPHSLAQSGCPRGVSHSAPTAKEPGKGQGQGRGEDAPTESLWSLHTNPWVLMSRHLSHSKGAKGPLPMVSRLLLCRTSPPHWGLLSGRWRGAARAHGDT